MNNNLTVKIRNSSSSRFCVDSCDGSHVHLLHFVTHQLQRWTWMEKTRFVDHLGLEHTLEEQRDRKTKIMQETEIRRAD